jgi:hypothetical protein
MTELMSPLIRAMLFIWPAQMQIPKEQRGSLLAAAQRRVAWLASHQVILPPQRPHADQLLARTRPGRRPR